MSEGITPPTERPGSKSDDPQEKPWIRLPEVPTQDDFTHLIEVATPDDWRKFLERCGPKRSAFHERLKRLPAAGKTDTANGSKQKSIYSISEIIRIKDDSGADVVEGRALICLCNRGEAVSITVRVMYPLPDEAGGQQKLRKRLRSDCEFGEVERYEKGPFAFSNSASAAVTGHLRYQAREKADVFCSYDILCELLRDELFSADVPLPPQGLLVVSGLTNSGKSTITRGLIWLILRKLLKKWHEDNCKNNALGERNQKKQATLEPPEKEGTGKRCVHLLTFEDPIETPIVSGEQGLKVNHDLLRHLRLDATAREGRKDATGLKYVLRDALRQTPSVVYVGEVRDRSEWEAIFEFAGTGHFIVATTHAGSLTETFTKLFQAVRATTPAVKGIYAQRLFGVINLREIKPLERGNKIELSRAPGQKLELSCVLPAVWRRSAGTIARLVSDGLASLLPARGTPNTGCYGRAHFAEKVIEWITLVKDGAEQRSALTPPAERAAVEGGTKQQELSTSAPVVAPGGAEPQPGENEQLKPPRAEQGSGSPFVKSGSRLHKMGVSEGPLGLLQRLTRAAIELDLRGE